MRTLALLLLCACSGRVVLGEDAGGSVPDPDAGLPTDDAGLPTDDAGLPTRGARVPWIEYEAEDGRTNAEIVGPSRALGTAAGEASGRRAVVLDAPGEFVEWTIRVDANAVVLRYSLPDAPAGGGIDATLGLYVDGSRRATLALSSRQAWVYGGDDRQFNQPSAGAPRRIYSEAHRLLDFTIAAGSTLRLQMDASDRSPYYAIDFVDLERVGPPLPAPAGFVSITDASQGWPPAIPDDGQPDDEAINQCLNAAMAGRFAGVYIPPGTFEQRNKFQAKGITVQGAGIWHSCIYNADLGEDPGWGQTGFIITGDRAHFSDFAIFGNTDGLRTQGGKAWVNSAFADTLIENMWVENVQCGYWVGGPSESTRLVIRNSRFRNTGADAVNLCNGTRDSLLENNHARHTGDDAFAIWSATDLYPQPDRDNVIRRCTVQLTWRAAAFAIYGGSGNRIEDSVAYDTLTYPGLTVSSEFNPFPLESATIDGLTLVRTGGSYWGGQEFGAIWIRADQNPTRGIHIRHVDVVAPTFQGIRVQSEHGGAFEDVSFEDVTITRPSTYGIEIQPGAAGGASFEHVVVDQPARAPLHDQSGGGFAIEDRGGNNW
jgi:Right handed beta helix region